MTLRPDPFTEIREALERYKGMCDDDALDSRGAWKLSKEAEAARAALATLEREAAERETALRAMMTTPSGEGQEELAKARRGEGLTDMETLFALRGAMEVVDVMLAERKTLRLESEARVREVEAERDRWVVRFETAADALDAAEKSIAMYQLREHDSVIELRATVARQAEAMRVEPLAKIIAEWLVEWADDESDSDHFRRFSRYPIPSWAESEKLAERIIAAVLASPEAPAAEPRDEPHLSPYRCESVNKNGLRCMYPRGHQLSHGHRGVEWSVGAAVLPAVDAATPKEQP